jgi:hypothetical protein
MKIVAIEVYPTKGRLTVEVFKDPDSGSSPNKVESDEVIAPISKIIIVSPSE